jgi:hypothetical protein
MPFAWNSSRNDVQRFALIWISFTATLVGVAWLAVISAIFCMAEMRSLPVPVGKLFNQTLVTRSFAVSPPLQEQTLGPNISVRPFDELARIGAKLAREQRIQLLQLQSDPVNTPPGHLVKSRIRLLVRGDYVDTKTFLISLLGNFHGLALDRLTIRHVPMAGGTGSGMPGTQGSADESTIELIQYGAPVRVSG